MKLVSMSLALFFGAVLAITTDAAPGGLKKDGESASVHRSLDSVAELAAAEAMCTTLETFDGLGRGENKKGLDWTHCDGNNNSPNEDLCPTNDAVAAICSAKNPLLNPAVKKNWCIPSFAILDNDDRRADCVLWCTNYVSAARGDCCDMDCTSIGPEEPAGPAGPEGPEGPD
jgi:hypothetical protein